MRYASFAGESFWTCYDGLPSEIRKQADKQFELFSSNPGHPSIRLKPVGPFWSARINDAYRALARRRGDTFYWFWIGTHADYERLLNRDG